jgi:hypothetical protein
MNYNDRVFQHHIKALGLYNRDFTYSILLLYHHHCLLILMNILVLGRASAFLQCDIQVHFYELG